MAERKFQFGDSVLHTRRDAAQERKMVQEEKTVQELVSAVEHAAEPNAAFRFKFVPREKLAFNEKNQYPMDAIEELAESILQIGLIHNIDVSYDDERDVYVIDAGEQRVRAIDLLISRYRDFDDTEGREYQYYLANVKPFEEGYPCKVSRSAGAGFPGMNMSDDEAKELAAIDTEMRLYASNEIGRRHNAVRTQEAVQRLVDLAKRRNELMDPGEKVNINRSVGEQLHISERQVQKYKAVERLIPELKDKFRTMEISLTEAAQYANLEKKEQQKVVTDINAAEKQDSVQNDDNDAKNCTIVRTERDIASLERVLKKIAADVSNIAELQELQNSDIQEFLASSSISEFFLKLKTCQRQLSRIISSVNTTKGAD